MYQLDYLVFGTLVLASFHGVDVCDTAISAVGCDFLTNQVNMRLGIGGEEPIRKKYKELILNDTDGRYYVIVAYFCMLPMFCLKYHYLRFTSTELT